MYEPCRCGQLWGRFHLINKLGGCPRCMRLAFWGSVVAWLGVAGAVLLTASWSWRLAALVVACGLSALWLAHWGAFIGKALTFRDDTQTARRAFLRDLLACAMSGLWLSLEWRQEAFAQVKPRKPRCPEGSIPCLMGFMPPPPGGFVGDEVCVEFIPNPKVPESDQWKATCEKARAGAMASLEKTVVAAAQNRCALSPCSGHAKCRYHAHQLEGVACEVRAVVKGDPKTKKKRRFCCYRCRAQRVWLLCCCLP